MKEKNDTKNSKDKCVLGINCAYHEPSACLIKNGKIVATVEEERFNRIRHGKPANLLNPHWLPINSIKFCLDFAGIKPGDIDFIGFSFVPEKRLAFNVGRDEETIPEGAGTPQGEGIFYKLLMTVPNRLSETLGEDISGRFHWIEHHLCHASSAYFVSPFEESAILSADGIGEATCTWLGFGKENKIKVIKEILYPNSIGLLWTKMSRFLGFGEYGQWKVMGLAGYGDPENYYKKFKEFITFDSNGKFTIDNKYLEIRLDTFSGLENLFGKARGPEDNIEDRHQDIAASLQKVTNESLLVLSQYLYKKTRSKNLCIAGGVGLNCISNRIILEEGHFENIFIQPAANDAGTALGVCFYIWNQILNHKKEYILQKVYTGPFYTDQQICETLKKYHYEVEPQKNLESVVARLISNGKIIAWYQGRMEFGPRALGNRSILADPRRSNIVHLLNDKIKQREFFRPYAASVLMEKAKEWFNVEKPSLSDEFMLIVRRVREEKLGEIPAVTHIEGTSRIQIVNRKTNPRFYKLIIEFEKITGVPLLLNTSFNDREPIICSPEDAVKTCINSGIDFLVIGDYVVDIQNDMLCCNKGI